MPALMTIGLMLKAYDQMSSVVNGAASKSVAGIAKVQASMKKLSDQAGHFGRQATASGLVAGAAALKPLQAFADLEDATTDLKIAMLDSLGQVPRQFELINQQAIELGNILPGTTADFIGVARALQEQGTGMDSVLNGGLKAASYLSVLLKMPGAEAGEMVAKLREAYGLADNELEKMADLVQRARFAFGMTPQDIKIASSYSGATQNILGLKGMDNAKQLLALQGLGAGVSLEGSSWGTNFAMMLNRMADTKDRLAKNSKEMKALNADLKGAGINLEFFNAKGEFMGLQNMVAQLEKLNKLTDVDKLNALKKLFGAEAARPAAIIADKGVAGFQDAIQKMEQQASLQQRIELSLGTLSNTWDALAGTATNALAMIGEPLAHLIFPYIAGLNQLVGGPVMAWIEEHRQLVGVLGAALLAFALLATGLGVLGFAVSAMSSGLSAMLGVWRGGLLAWRLAGAGIAAVRGQIMGLMVAQRAQMALQALQNAVAYRGGVWKALQYSLLTTKYRMLEGVGAARAWIVSAALWTRANLLSLSGLRGLAAAFGGALVNGIKAAAVAVRALSLALLTNPVAWIVAAIAGAAFLIYRYWKPISGFFKGLWQGLVQGVQPLMGALGRIGAVAGRIFGPFIGPIKALWGWFKNLTGQVEDTGGAARNLGVRVGQGIGKAIVWVAKLGQSVLELPGQFYNAGVEMMAGLWRGIQSRWGTVTAGISNLAGSIASSFKGALGIHSPSKVFMGYGANITQGAALGMIGGIPQIRRASKAMTTATLASPPVYGPAAIPRRAGSLGPGGGMVVHFSPAITVQGPGGDAGGQVKAAMRDAYREFEAHLRRYDAERKRRAF
jgi:TP901 family phage tail tape measure protein